MKLIFSSAIALVFAAGTTAAFAEANYILQDDFDEVTAVVSFADLNLARPADAKILLDRIQGAVRQVCRRATEGDSFNMMKNRRLCRTATYEKSVAAINAKKNI